LWGKVELWLWEPGEGLEMGELVLDGWMDAVDDSMQHDNWRGMFDWRRLVDGRWMDGWMDGLIDSIDRWA